MKKILFFISSYDREKSNSYYLGEYIEKKLNGRAKCLKIILDGDEIRNIEKTLADCDNVILISSLRNNKLNDLSENFLNRIDEINKKEKFKKKICFSTILSGDIETLKEIEEIESVLDRFIKVCNKNNIIWQKGIGILAKLNLWESGLENNEIEYNQLLIELEMFCEDIINEKKYHHNSFAIPRKGSGIFKFINNRIKQFT